MTLTEIKNALSKAQKGIFRYAELMSLFMNVDVSTDRDFQRSYNAFYRVQRRQESWYKNYYDLMESLKGSDATFDGVLDEIHRITGRYEPSFASKLVATINPSKPIWDVHVLANTGHKGPSYSNKNKLELAKDAYISIEAWYAEFLESDDGKNCINEFNRKFPMHLDFTDVKKVDFVLWQIRN